MMKNMFRKIIASLLAVCLMLGSVPVYADTEADQPIDPIKSIEAEDVPYIITIDHSIVNGTVTAPETAMMDAPVTLTVTPDEGYVLESITVTTVGGNNVPVNEGTFVMPADNVTVTATFKQLWMIESDRLWVYGSLTKLPNGEYSWIEVTETGELNGVVTDVAVTNSGSITGGMFKDNVYNLGTISDSTFGGFAQNTGRISKGTFNGFAQNIAGSTISDSTFFDGVYNAGMISDGTFYGEVFNDFTISSSKFTTSADVTDEGTITTCMVEHYVNGEIMEMLYDENLLEQLPEIEAGWTWCVDGEPVGQDDTVPLPVKTYYFKQLRDYNVAIVAPENGTVQFADGYTSPTLEGEWVCLDIQPDEGYVLDEVIITGESGDEYDFDDDSSFLMPGENVTVTVTFREAEYYTVTLNSAENGTVQFADGYTSPALESVWFYLNIQPDEGYMLDEVIVTGESGDEYGFDYSDNSFWMPRENVTVTVIFTEAEYYTVTLADTENGTVAFAEGYTSPAQAGEWFYLDIQPDEGYVLDEVIVTGESGDEYVFNYSANNFQMPRENVTVTVIFREVEYYTVTLNSAENGTVRFEDGYSSPALESEWFYLDIQPDEGYVLDEVIVIGESGDEYVFDYNGNGFYMPRENVTVTVTFIATVTETEHYTVTLDAVENGTVAFAEGYTSPTQAGEWFYLDIQPDEGYVLDEVIVIGESGAEYDFDYGDNSFLMPWENVTVIVTFIATVTAAEYYTVTLDAVENGTVAFAEGYTSPAQAGEWFYLDIQPDEGYVLDEVIVTGESGDEYVFYYSGNSFLMPWENVTVTVTFVIDTDGGDDGANGGTGSGSDEPAGALTVTRDGDTLVENNGIFPGDTLTADWSGMEEVTFRWVDDDSNVLAEGDTYTVPEELSLPNYRIYVIVHGADGEELEYLSFLYVDGEFTGPINVIVMALKAVDGQGNDISGYFHGEIAGYRLDNATEGKPCDLVAGEHTLVFDSVPSGYAMPANVTITVTEQGVVTSGSGHAEVVAEGGYIQYIIVVTLEEKSSSTEAPTTAPTDAPTEAPTDAPTTAPTGAPTDAPTDAPTGAPTDAPTTAPTGAPTGAPTAAPTDAPTTAPTGAPTGAPTAAPTGAPTTSPTGAPTTAPTGAPTTAPTGAPTGAPTAAPTDAPTTAPTGAPTTAPTDAPTDAPTTAPTDAPTTTPTDTPTDAPAAPPTAEPTDAPAEDSGTLADGVVLPEIEQTGSALYDDYVGTGDGLGQLHIVFDGEYEPEDYELLDVFINDERQGNSALICALPDKNGETDRRSLVLSADQLVKLVQQQETEHIIFENGNAIAEMDMVDILGGDLSKLMALILSGEEEITPETLERDWSLMEPAVIPASELAKIDVETRIVPAEQEDGAVAYEVSVWLRWNDQELNVSSMIPSLTVALSVDDLVNEDNFDTFTDMYTIVYRAPGAQEALPLASTLLLMPDELPEHQEDVAQRFVVNVSDEEDEHPVTAYEANAHLVPYRHYVLAADYAGDGVYWVQKAE